ncbi:hypothetical protein [Paenibacillus sp. CMAA1364]
MSLAIQEFIHSFSTSMEGIIMASIAIILFIWMYIRTALHLRMTRKEQLERLHESLILYSRVTGPLGEMIDDDHPSTEDVSHLVFLLEECKAAPMLTQDLHEHMNAYIKERDPSRLSMLYNVWMREVNRLIEDHRMLLRKWDRPSWGFSFWLLLKPALPFAAVTSIVMSSLQLSDTLSELSSWESSHWLIMNAWARYISYLVATASIYLLFMYTRRKSYHFVHTILYLFIAIAALFHVLGLQSALYIVAIQVILYVAGFGFNTTRTRKDRPYAGRDFLGDDQRQQDDN